MVLTGMVKKQNSGTLLLRAARKEKLPLLAVVATSFDDVSALDCILSWLVSRYDALECLLPGNKDWTLQHLSRTMQCLCSSDLILALEKAFRLFDCRNPLLHYFKFHCSCLLYKYADAKRYLRYFTKLCRKSEYGGSVETALHDSIVHQSKELLPWKLGGASWVMEVAIALLDKLVARAPSDFERGKILEIVVNCKLSTSRYIAMLKTFQLLQAANQPGSLIYEPPETILKVLVEHKHYQFAQRFAKQQQLDCSFVILRQAQDLVAEYKSRGVWSDFSQRLRAWEHIQRLFLESQNQNCFVFGSFFLQQDRLLARLHADAVRDEEEEVAQEITKTVTVERQQLLSLAGGWLHKHSHFLSQREVASSEGGSSLDSDSTAIQHLIAPTASEDSVGSSNAGSVQLSRVRLLLQRIEICQLLLTIGANLEALCLVTESLTSVPDDTSSLLPVSLRECPLLVQQLVEGLLRNSNLKTARLLCQEFAYIDKVTQNLFFFLRRLFLVLVLAVCVVNYNLLSHFFWRDGFTCLLLLCSM